MENNCVKSLQFFFVLSMLTVACSKSNKIVEPINNSLIGKWTYTEYYYSIGGPGEWHPVIPAGQTIEFKTDGTFIPSESFLKGANKFEIIDTATVKIQPASTSVGYVLMGYKIKTQERELELYPVNPMCIDGCSNKFIEYAK